MAVRVLVVGGLAMTGSDEIMESTLFLGTYPGLTIEMLKHEINVISEFCSS